MRRYLNEWRPCALPSCVASFSFHPVAFAIRGRYCYVPGDLLFTTPSIFTSFLHSTDGDGMKAAIKMVEDTATSAKVFDLVFQPLMYGYLDVDEINEKNKQEQHLLGLLVDGLKLADKIKSVPVVSLIKEELAIRYDGPGSVTINGIKKLFEARPMIDDFLFQYLSHGVSLFRNPKVLQAARQWVTGFTEFGHTYLSLPSSEEAPNPDMELDIHGSGISEETRNVAPGVTAPSTDEDIASFGSDGVSKSAADGGRQSESAVKQGKRPEPPVSCTDEHTNEEATDENAMSTAKRDPVQHLMFSNPTTNTRLSPDVEAEGDSQFSTAPTSPESHEPPATRVKGNMKQPTGNGRETRGTKRKVAFDNEPKIHPISSPVDVPSLPKPAIIDLKEGPPSRRLRQRGPAPSGNTPEPQHTDEAKPVEKNAAQPKASKNAPAKDITKARDTAKARTRAASKAQLEAIARPETVTKAATRAKATAAEPTKASGKATSTAREGTGKRCPVGKKGGK